MRPLWLVLAWLLLLAMEGLAGCTPKGWRANAEAEARATLGNLCPHRDFRVVCGPFSDYGYDAICTVSTSSGETLQITCDDDISALNDGCSDTGKIVEFCRRTQPQCGVPQ